MCKPTTQIERQEALFLLEAIRTGRSFMDPEPWHVRAIIELMDEEPHGRRTSFTAESFAYPLVMRQSA